MSSRTTLLIAAVMALSGCCGGTRSYVGLGTDSTSNWVRVSPIQSKIKIKPKQARKSEAIAVLDPSLNESELIGLKPYSKEWWIVRDAIDLRYEAQLTKKLVICRNCLPASSDETGSIPTRQ